jgi:hypothetical protein
MQQFIIQIELLCCLIGITIELLPLFYNYFLKNQKKYFKRLNICCLLNA